MRVEQIKGILSIIESILKLSLIALIILLVIIICLLGGYLVGAIQEREVKKMDINNLLTKVNNAEDGTLASTVEGMLSDDYKERFLAEYKQAYIRYTKLDVMLMKAKLSKLDFELKSRLRTLEKQRSILLDYIFILEERAKQENINVHVY